MVTVCIIIYKTITQQKISEAIEMKLMIMYMKILFFPFMLFLCNSLLLAQESPMPKPLPEFPEWMYESRLKELDQNTTIKLDYNKQVRAYIDVYTLKRREHFSRIIGRAELYFPLFEEYLAKYNLPMELKYLAIIESALDPTAKSSSGAMGLWQFLYQSGRLFDLKVDTYVDERCDPIKSTDAACRYLAYLYQNLNDWQLALAAYNGGLGVVQKAIERSGGITNYWDLQPFLPVPVQGYVPAFIAANYSMNNYAKHEISSTPPIITFDEVDTIYIYKPLSFEQIHKASGTPIELIKWLNPSYTKQYIPVKKNPVPIFLPKENIPTFIQGEKELQPLDAPIVSSPPFGDKDNRFESIHIVRKGEFFHKIAIRYQCRIGDIMEWNNLDTKQLQAGQKLVVWKPILEIGHFAVLPEVDVSKIKIPKLIAVKPEYF